MLSKVHALKRYADRATSLPRRVLVRVLSQQPSTRSTAQLLQTHPSLLNISDHRL